MNELRFSFFCVCSIKAANHTESPSSHRSHFYLSMEMKLWRKKAAQAKHTGEKLLILFFFVTHFFLFLLFPMVEVDLHERVTRGRSLCCGGVHGMPSQMPSLQVVSYKPEPFAPCNSHILRLHLTHFMISLSCFHLTVSSVSSVTKVISPTYFSFNCFFHIHSACFGHWLLWCKKSTELEGCNYYVHLNIFASSIDVALTISNKHIYMHASF